MADADRMHGLEPAQNVVEHLQSARHVEIAGLQKPLERGALDELHNEDGLGPASLVEEDKPSDVWMSRQRHEGGGLLTKHLQEFGLAQAPGSGRRVFGHFELKSLCAIV